jgi:hypothetical protein
MSINDCMVEIDPGEEASMSVFFMEDLMTV